MPRPRALFLTPTLPARTGNGLAMRMGLFLEAMCRFAEVEVVVVPVISGASVQMATNFLQELGVKTHVIPIKGSAETHFSLLTRMRDPELRLKAFQVYGKPSLASVLSGPVLTTVSKILGAYAPDIVHIGRVCLSESVTTLLPRTVATLDLDEDELTSFFTIARLVGQTGSKIDADWLRQEGRACDALISSFGGRFQRLFVSSKREVLSLAGRHDGLQFQQIENAVDIPSRVARRDDGGTFVFVGSLGYLPNADGILWFTCNVLPRLRSIHHPPVQLLIAGAQPPAAVAALARQPHVSVLGQVPNLAALYQQATLALAPMRAGGGTRIKLLEAAAQGVASISTTTAAEGIEWPRDAGGWRAWSASDFAAACHEGLSSAIERDRRAMMGLNWVRRHHSREHLIARIASTLKSALEESRSDLAPH